MIKEAIVYHGGFRHSKLQAEAVHRGAVYLASTLLRGNENNEK